MQDVLIIDDDHLLCGMIEKKIRKLGLTSRSAHSLQEAYALFNQQTSCDLILLDVNLPDGNGIDALQRLKQAPSQPEIIIITGTGDATGAEMALETGAWDYISKPISTRELELQIKRALDYRKEKLNHSQILLLERSGIIGDDPSIKSCLEKVALAAPTEQAVLITGETGTGKELFARAIHANSERKTKPFVVLDCAAFPSQLVESVLFGHIRGAFTGADASRDGLLLQADGGTLFLDEVGELPLEIQKKFLRVLQERTFRPIGLHKEVKSNFRLLAATNRDLEGMVSNGVFRQDLLYRLSGSNLHLPSLRERKSDIEVLTLHYIHTVCKYYNIPIKGMSQEFLQFLQDYAWPGNVRELTNTIESAVTAAQKHEILLPIHLPVKLRVSITREKFERCPAAPPLMDTKESCPAPFPTLKESINTTEKNYILSLLEFTSGDIPQACSISGLSRTGLYERLKRYNITR